ncbi:hypothetical protein DH2020_042513 [Rehmannia glutinosa]|uniref:F-box domain-containing protein n=1 Tax=Rehmannia glutinosa TaxID=99300 RepID=A0ABR0UMP3_REHGL
MGVVTSGSSALTLKLALYLEAMEEQSLRSMKKMGKAKEKTQIGCQSIISGIDDLGDDLMQNILSRLPALYFASAACVSRSWNSLCNRILSYPKLSSAVSFNRYLQNAVNEVVDKVLLEPIRPHFALVSIGPALAYKQLSNWIPVIINVSEGVIGKDVRKDHFVEVQWEVTEEQETYDAILPDDYVNRGIILTVGFLPGLKAHIVPLLFQNKGPRSLLADEFVMDIREAASAVSDSASPAGIILFADPKTDIKPVLQKIVALLFARDRNKPLGIGETQFHVMLSTGVSPVGQAYKAVSVKCNKTSTWLTASRETVRENLDGQAILEDIYDELGDRIQYPAFYIGVTKRRRCLVGMERVRRMQFLEFHEVLGGDEEYLFVDSVGITTADPFRFYISDSKAALASCNKVSDSLRHLKLDSDCKNDHVSGGVGDCDKRKVFGGIIFSCCGRGESFFGRPGIDSAPFLNNFPGVTFGERIVLAKSDFVLSISFIVSHGNTLGGPFGCNLNDVDEVVCGRRNVAVKMKYPLKDW